jgi:molybdopterin-containing oxidoreductase family membrane subunit
MEHGAWRASGASFLRQPLVAVPKSFRQVTEDIAGQVCEKPGALWWVAFLLSAGAFAVGLVAMTIAMVVGMGVWGINRTVGWGFDIANFVFWIGIGHAGTMISAVLYLFGQRWRTSINRVAEGMTVFAVACAGLYPLIHMGRPWYFYWIAPHPNSLGPLWVNFRSPLLWDFFAILTYLTVSAIFWYVGMIPDLATLRDRVRSPLLSRLYGFFSLGWDGSARAWHRYEATYALLALIATPLVVAVCAIVSSDFCTSVIPGWHATIFPPYFLAGAIFCGFAMALGLLLVTRKALSLEEYITAQHINWMCKVLLIGSFVIGFVYAIEFFIAWYSGNAYELSTMVTRATGPYAWAYWTMVASNVVAPQVLWFRRARRTPWLILIVCLLVNLGMWCERFIIVVTSLHRDYLPSSWTMYLPSANEMAILIGMFGLFFSLYLLFTRLLPVIPINEIKGVLDYARETAAPSRLPAPGSRLPAPGSREQGSPREPGAWSSELGASSSEPGGKSWSAATHERSERYCTGYFDSQEELLEAVVQARRRGYDMVDAFSPYPVHGLSQALGLRPSRLGWVAFGGGLLAVALILALQVWTSAYDWPLRVGGQPTNAWSIWIPVTAMVGFLSATGVGVIAFCARARLWPGKRARSPRGVTDDRFALVLRETDASVDLEEMSRTLRAAGANAVTEGDEWA